MGSKIYKFDGVDDTIDISSVGALNLHNADYTIYIKYKPVDATGTFLFGEGNSANDYIKFSDTGVLIIEDSADTVFQNDFGAGFNINEENELYIYFDSTADTINIKLNGVTGTPVTNNLVTSFNSSKIGVAKTSEYYTGDMYEVKIWDDITETSLIAKYDLRNNSKLGVDQVKDLSGNGNHGTSYGKGEFTRTTTKTVKDHNGNIVEVGIDVPAFEGARYINDDKGFSEFKGENAVEFDASNGEAVDIGMLTYFTSNVDECSFSAWINVNDIDFGNQGIIVSDARFIFAIDGAANKLWLRVRDENNTAYIDVRSNTILEDNKTYFVTATFNNGVSKLYINGILDNITSSTGLAYFISDGFYVGGWETGDRNIGGMIDNPVIWNTALSGEQVMQQYLYSKKGNSYLVAPENVVGAWKLDDTSSTIIDYSGNGNDGTFNSGGVPATPTLVEGVYDSGTKISSDTLKGILIEEQRTNEITYSEELDTNWINTRVVLAQNALMSPRLDNSAVMLTDTIDDSTHYIYQDSGAISGSHTWSIFAKNGTSKYIRMKTDAKSTSPEVTFNLENGTLETGDAGILLDYGIKEFGNGWYRCYMSFDVDTTNYRHWVNMLDDNKNTSYSGGTGTVYLWGAQSEEGSFPTSYIKTEASSVTRTADVSSYDMSEQLTQGQGSLYIEFEQVGQGATNFARPITLHDGTGENHVQIYIRGDNQNMVARIKTNNVNEAQITGPQVEFGSKYKALVTYEDNNIKFYVNGILKGTDTNATVAINLKQLDLGNDSTSTYVFNGNEKYFKYYKEVLSEDEAKGLTQ